MRPVLLKPVQVDGWYPPTGIPAAATVDIQGDARPEIIVSLNDGCMYAFDADARRLWRYNYTRGKAIMYASEVSVADLNQDGSPELLFSTYGAPDDQDAGHLVMLSAAGGLLFDTPLPAPATTAMAMGRRPRPRWPIWTATVSWNLVQTFDHGLDIFRVPDSGCNCLLWTTARGGPLRKGTAGSGF